MSVKDWFKSRDSKLDTKTRAYSLWKQGKNKAEIATQLGIPIDQIVTFEKDFPSIELDRFTQVSRLFMAGKSIFDAAQELGLPFSEVKQYYIDYLREMEEVNKIVQKKESISKEQPVPPYYIEKLVRNPDSGVKNRIERCPDPFDTMPVSCQDPSIWDWAQTVGDGVARVRDSKGKIVGQIPISGVGFDDPIPLEDVRIRPGMGGMPGRPGFPNDRFNRFRRFPPPGAGFRGGHGQGDGGYPLQEGEVDFEARREIDREDRRNDIYLRASELYLARGNAAAAERMMKKVDQDNMSEEQKFGLVEAADELSALTGEDSKDLLKRLLGGQKDSTEGDSEEEKWGRVFERGSKAFKENILEPAAEMFGRDRDAGQQLDREALGIPGGQMAQANPGLPPVRRPKFRKIGTVIRKTEEHKEERKESGMIEEDMPDSGEVNEEDNMSPEVNEETMPENPDNVPSNESQESIVINPPTQLPPHQGPSQEQESSESMQPAEDAMEPVTENDIQQPLNIQTTKPKRWEDLSFSEKWMVNNGFSMLSTHINMWAKGQKNGSIQMERINNPEGVAKEHYHDMFIGPKSIFVGKKRQLDVYRAAKRGAESLMEEWRPFVQEQILQNEVPATILRSKGPAELFKQFEFPPSISRGKVLGELQRYINLKTCWDTFTSPKGMEWFGVYQKVFIQCVETGVKTKYMNKDTSVKTENVKFRVVKPRQVQEPQRTIDQKILEKVAEQHNPLSEQNIEENADITIDGTENKEGN